MQCVWSGGDSAWSGAGVFQPADGWRALPRVRTGRGRSPGAHDSRTSRVAGDDRTSECNRGAGAGRVALALQPDGELRARPPAAIAGLPGREPVARKGMVMADRRWRRIAFVAALACLAAAPGCQTMHSIKTKAANWRPFSSAY